MKHASNAEWSKFHIQHEHKVFSCIQLEKCLKWPETYAWTHWCNQSDPTWQSGRAGSGTWLLLLFLPTYTDAFCWQNPGGDFWESQLVWEALKKKKNLSIIILENNTQGHEELFSGIYNSTDSIAGLMFYPSRRHPKA